MRNVPVPVLLMVVKLLKTFPPRLSSTDVPVFVIVVTPWKVAPSRNIAPAVTERSSCHADARAVRKVPVPVTGKLMACGAATSIAASDKLPQFPEQVETVSFARCQRGCATRAAEVHRPGCIIVNGDVVIELISRGRRGQFDRCCRIKSNVEC